MNKKMRFSVLALALILTFSFLFAACRGKPINETPGSIVPKTIVITGLSGKSGQVSVGVFSSADDPGVSGDGVIKEDGSVTVDLKNKNGTPWANTGSYFITLSLGSDEFFVYSNGKNRTQIGIKGTESEEQLFEKMPKYKISSTTSTIPFNLFVDGEDLFDGF